MQSFLVASKWDLSWDLLCQSQELAFTIIVLVWYRQRLGLHVYGQIVDPDEEIRVSESDLQEVWTFLRGDVDSSLEEEPESCFSLGHFRGFPLK